MRLADGLCFPVEVLDLGGVVVLVELGLVEQRYQAGLPRVEVTAGSQAAVAV